MTHDKQKLEYLLSQLKADGNGRYRIITKSGNIEDNNMLYINNYSEKIDIDATATANGVQWPTIIDPKAESPRMFTEQEMYDFARWRISNQGLNVDVWLKSKEEKLMLGENVSIGFSRECGNHYINFVCDHTKVSARNVTPEQLIKLAEKLKSLNI